MTFNNIWGVDIYGHKRVGEGELMDLLSGYDIISFDVFDTLIFRPFNSPRVLFSIMEKRLGIYKFSKIRVDCEDEIRGLYKKKYGNDNVTLDEIYELISSRIGVSLDFSKMEYELELNYCYANSYFKKIVSICKRQGKKVIICSDMYLSKDQIIGILKNCFYPSFDEIYVSSECKKSKKKGDIYDFLRELYCNQKILHIGNNYTDDIENARLRGIDAFYYESPMAIGGKKRIDDMSYITGNIYSAIVNNHLYCENKIFEEEYKLGYIYGGIYVLGFVQWVNIFAKDHRIDKIFFLSRDGDVYSKVYNKLPEHKKWIYFYWSRLAGIKVTAFENFYEFCQRMIWHKARGVYNIKIKHIINYFEIQFLSSKLCDYDLLSDDILSPESAEKLEKMFYDNKTQILKSFENDISATFNYVKDAVGQSKSIAIVDVGWAGTGALILKNIINKYLNINCKVYSLLAGYTQPIENISSLYVMDGFIHSYLFSYATNKDLLDMHLHSGTKMNNLLLEIFTQSCSPSFLGYTKNGLKFDQAEIENYEIIKKITKGVEDFCDQYIKIFKQDAFLLNISPYDAYMPFNRLKNEIERLRPILSRLVISRGKFYDAENTSNETYFSFFNKSDN